MITSLQNTLIRKILKLQQKASARRADGLFVAEGRREVSLAIAAGVEVARLLVCPEIYHADSSYPIGLKEAGDACLEVSLQVYNKISFRKDAEGVLLVGRTPVYRLDGIRIKECPLLLVVERVEKPGNLGAILRTADAAGVDAVILTDPVTDIFNPNVIRSSLGCAFTLPVITCQTHEAIAWLKENGIGIYAAALQTDILYVDVNLRGPAALVFGAEDAGLGQAWRDAANHIIKIPMSGRIDSLNVSASVAILAFEAIRQRRE
jgi:RNA methyltransferase, TrmH family